MASDKKQEKKRPRDEAQAELKLIANEYRYRDQLMVTEFALTMTAVGVAGNILVRLDHKVLELLILWAATVFLFIVSMHLFRLDIDRRAARKTMQQCYEELGWQPAYQGLLLGVTSDSHR